MTNDVLWTTVGAIAALLTSFGFVPQVLKMWRRRSAGDVSVGTFIQFSFGVVLWALYGVYRGDAVVIGANVVTLATLTVGLVLFYRFRTAEAGNAIVATVNGAQEIGADVTTVLQESSHALIHGVAKVEGDVKAAARAVVMEAIQAAESGRIEISPAEAASAAVTGATKAAAEVNEKTAREVGMAVTDLIPLAA